MLIATKVTNFQWGYNLFILGNSVDKLEPTSIPKLTANFNIFLNFTPDYYNRTFKAAFVPDPPYQVKPGTASYQVKMLNPINKNYTMVTGLNQGFNGVLPNESGTFNIEVSGELNDPDDVVFLFPHGFTLSDEDLARPKLDFTPDNGIGAWEGSLTEAGGQQFLGGSIRWQMDRLSPNSATSIESSNSGAFNGAIQPAGSYVLHVQFKYLNDNTQHSADYPITFP
jgi:hypothetical protein